MSTAREKPDPAVALRLAPGPEAADQPEDVIHAAADAYLAVDPAGVIVDWNRAAERLFGWAGPEAVARSTVGAILAAPGGADPEPIVECLSSAAQGPQPGRRLELGATAGDGRTFPVEASVWATATGDALTLHALVHDISDRVAAQEGLYRMAMLVYSLDEAILGVGREGTVLSWNAGAERTFGYAPFEVVGKAVSMLVPAGQRAEVCGWWERLRSEGDVQRHEIVGARKNGVTIDLALAISPIRDAHGDVSGASVIARDVTEQRWMASTLETTLQSLESALKETRESEARCRRFLADAAHQLRTPIAGIRASAETILRGSAPAERDQMLLNVVRETSRASRVMTGLLRMARVDQGETLTFQSCDLVALCDDEVVRSRSLAPELRVDLRVGDRPAPRLLLDANVVREVLSNLLDNARRHASHRIEVVVGARGKEVEVWVLDDGPGLGPAVAERAFERFVTLDGKGGSGLGLPIAKGLAQAHGGDLTYEDGFVLRVPRGEAGVHCGGAGRPGPTR